MLDTIAEDIQVSKTKREQFILKYIFWHLKRISSKSENILRICILRLPESRISSLRFLNYVNSNWLSTSKQFIE